MNILYVYGYGSNANSETVGLIQKVFKDDNVYCIDYPQYDIEASVKKLQQFVKSHGIQLVIASSLGGFIALFLRNVVKIIINPCMKPSIELPKIGAKGTILASVAEYEKKLKDIPFENTTLTFGVFSTHDELLGTQYVRMFRHYGSVRMTDTCGHRATLATIKELKEVTPHVFESARKEWLRI